ncbi:metallophosphoesterase family protein [candidate division KSB1 bacterium]|nr:metallophosphoesterase family protein [candidate division KSB1 bacterium]
MNKIAVLSDIHGNNVALIAVLEECREWGADSIINLGDVFYGPLDPAATFNLIRQTDMVTVSGNEDRLINEIVNPAHQDNPTLQYVREKLPPAALEWLRDLPAELIFDDFYCCHGSPGDDLLYLLDDVSDGTPVIRNEPDILRLLSGIDRPVILCGHSHLPRIVELSTGQLVVNPGSVGLQAYRDDNPVYHVMQTGSPNACFAMLEKINACWRAELFQVPYDYESAVKQAENNHRPDWAYSLVTGMVR